MNDKETGKGKLLLPEMGPPPTPVDPLVKLPDATEVVTINFDELKENSVVIIKINPEGMKQRVAATQQIAMALRPLRDSIQKKNIAFIVMSTQETMDILDPEQMADLGWERKEKNRIITL